MSLKGQWRTKRVEVLEVQRLLAANAAQECIIQSLCARVAELERNEGMCAREIPSVVQSKPILENEAHFRKLEDNPEWALILYPKYGDGQKRNLIYQHLHKLLGQLRSITGGDAMKAKQLGDLMYLRLHAGEERRQDTVQKWRVQAKPVRLACSWKRCAAVPVVPLLPLRLPLPLVPASRSLSSHCSRSGRRCSRRTMIGRSRPLCNIG
jgi:hypothetical protein